ncbi:MULTISPECIES: sensor histidine kinase [unclassified Polaromonas]|uniref:sensor histidine kinase n=1 Tax=unclassified Polaromonas TaxID=2638319 RepID=UPI000F07C76C|nr:MULTISPECIES: sensor histidine kinase [unclassified Polaromonas]AYQ29895.1 sensor histidine kinase [Polaromonas sp. SP1]QGJ18992.1 sensor histidine kinase [Polaromonas sp. Pch-P]
MKPGTRAFWRPDVLARFVRLLLVCGGLLAAGPWAWAADAVVHYTRAEMLREEGPRFKPLAAQVDEAALPGNWTTVELPLVIPKSAALPAASPAASGTAKPPLVTTWLRVRLDELQGMRTPTHFYLIRWLAAGQIAVYADGKLRYRSTGSPVWNLFNHPALLLPLNLTADSAPPRTLLIRMDSLPSPEAAISSFYAGDSNSLIEMAAKRDWLAYQLPFMSSAAFLAVGIFSLAVWVIRRHPASLLLFVIALMGAIRRWHFQLGPEKLIVSDAWFIWLTLNALMWQLLALHHFMQLLHGRVMRRLGWLMLGIAVVFSVITLPFASLVPSLLVIRPYAHLLLISMGTVVTAIGLWHSWRSPSPDAKMLSFALLISYVFGFYDWARLKYVLDLESYYLTPYAAMILFAVFVVIMFRQYVGALATVEQLNSGLEERLKNRETELAASYEKLREAEQRQTLSQERQRLTQDMHDGLGSSLVSALRVVEGGRLSEADVAEVLRGCIDDLKLTIDSMEPVEADLLLLLATLRFRLGPRLAGAGVSLQWEISDVPPLPWLDPRNALHILRILQEAFTNTLKHTRATQMRVTTGAQDGYVTVTITDNGGGFPVDQALAGGGKGLANQQRRAQAIGAEIVLTTNDAGTTLVLKLPEKRLPG